MRSLAAVLTPTAGMPVRTGQRGYGDGEPGAKAIWLGLKVVHVAAKTLQALRAGGNAGNCV